MKIRNPFKKYQNLDADQVQNIIKEFCDNKKKWKSDIHPFDGIVKKSNDIKYKFDKVNGIWNLRIY